MEGVEGGGAMAPARRGLRAGGESRAAAPWRPRPCPGPSPLPCPEASTAVGAGGGGGLRRRRRGRLSGSTSRRFGGGWVAGARPPALPAHPHVPGRRRGAGERPAPGREPGKSRRRAERAAERPRSACVAEPAAAAGCLRGVPVRPRGDSLPSRAGHPMRSPGGGERCPRAAALRPLRPD